MMHVLKNNGWSADKSILEESFTREYSASEIRQLLQYLFPARRLVLSQLTLFQHQGIASASGKTSKRGRQCYTLLDILPIAIMLALKEEGIPYKSVPHLPTLVRANAREIFMTGSGVRVSGFGNSVTLSDEKSPPPIEAFLSANPPEMLCWSFDVGLLSEQLFQVAEEYRLQAQKAA